MPELTEEEIREAGKVYAFITEVEVGWQKKEQRRGFTLEEPDFAMEYTSYPIEEIYSVILNDEDDFPPITQMLVEERNDKYPPAEDLERLDTYAEKYSNSDPEYCLWFKSYDEFQEILLPHLL